MNRILSFIFLLMICWACNSPEKNSETTATSTPKTTTETEVPATTETSTPAATVETYPPMPTDSIRMLFDLADYVDFVFYDANFSVSQNEKASVQASVRHISPDGATLVPNCQPRGRVFYQVEGKNRFEADFYLSNECLYLFFYQNGKKMYLNKFTEAGLNFYANIYRTATQQGGAQ